MFAPLGLVLVIGACGGSDDPVTASSSSAAPSSTAAEDSTSVTGEVSTGSSGSSTTEEGAGATPTTAGTPGTTTAGAALEDGRHFGFLQSLDLGGRTIAFDLAEFYTGDEANAEALADGVISEGESVDDDYYIRNVNPLVRVVPLGSDVGVLIVDCSGSGCVTTGGVLEDLQALAETRPVPVWIQVDSGGVVAIEEQYQP